MAHQNIDHTCRVELRFLNGDTNAQNVIHVSYDGSVSLADLDTLEAFLVTWLTDEWAAQAAPSWFASEVVITDENSLSGPRKSYGLGTDIVGTQVGDALPANCTIALKEVIGTRGRGKSGRIFWVGLAEAQVTGDAINPSVATALEAAGEALRTGIEGLGLPWGNLVVPHLVVGGVRPSTADKSIVESIALTDNVMDSQRDRLPFHMRHKKKPSTP